MEKKFVKMAMDCHKESIRKAERKDTIGAGILFILCLIVITVFCSALAV
ncbi:hypothetical protein M0R01_04625 [bacterium]|jgi:hypothetical protein|nr:hypothetical protein [bacterium]